MSRWIVLLAALALVAAGCGRESAGPGGTDSFAFVPYPGARYLPQLTEATKKAHTILKPNEEAPPVAIYDTDAPVDDVAGFYVKEYGYRGIAPEVSNDFSVVKPPAYRRSGDLAVDVKGIEPLLQKMNLATDVSKASGSYRAVEVAPKPNRPRVTIQRPYFDVTTSEVVDRTLILMAR
ncbi:MAG TPA: hypothetical protein VNL91_02720 [Thermoanaerobaculia bacterium]|nr:hypothetical protein [Thermoanaerobaculia bacterium]